MNHQTYIKSVIHDALELKRQVLESADLLDAIAQAGQRCVGAFEAGNKLMLAGNGGSAGDAQHIATELLARFERDRRALPAIALTTDSSILTAVSNDDHFDRVFSRQIEALGRPGDVFIGISTSGQSPSIIAAMACARALGLTTVALCGERGEIQRLADYVIAVPSASTARIQECHIMIAHILCGIIEASLE